MKRVINCSDEFYFGKDEADRYSDLIVKEFAGKTISKRKDIADAPGGLIYEADRLGIDMWDLLRALEGMCHQGKAYEIDDSTYKVKITSATDSRHLSSDKYVCCSTNDCKAVGRTWADFIQSIETDLGYEVYSAYRRFPDPFILLYKSGHEYGGEVTRYHHGGYELVCDNIFVVN